MFVISVYNFDSLEEIPIPWEYLRLCHALSSKRSYAEFDVPLLLVGDYLIELGDCGYRFKIRGDSRC